MDKQTQKKLLAIVENNYNEIASEYNESRKKSLGKSWAALLNIIEEVREGSRILDVGCGNGRLLEAFRGKSVKYMGVDSSEKLLEFAQKQKPGHDFRKNNILELGNISETNFDWVFSVAVLHHLPGRDLQIIALKQLKNKIHKDGKIVVTVWNMWSEEWKNKKFIWLIWKFWLLKLIGKNKMDFGDVVFSWNKKKGQIVSSRYYHAFRKCELRRIARQAGLKIEKLFKDEYNYYLVLKR